MSSRRGYSADTLRALRHDRRHELPESITATQSKAHIPTVKPHPPTPFTALSLPPPLLSSLEALSLTTATPIQATAIPYARLGGDLIAQATSATGKTLTYAVVVLESVLPPCRTKSALVIVPARELASQVADVFRSLSPLARVVTLIGGTKESADEHNLATPAHVVVGTPGRVEVMATRGCLPLESVKVLVLDEADRLLDGSFGGSVERICNILPPRQTLAFSATFPYALRVSLLRVMRDPGWIGGTAAIHTVKQFQILAKAVRKVVLLDRMLEEVASDVNLCVVFMNAKKAAAKLAKSLSVYKPRLIHAGIKQTERDAVVRDVRRGNVKLLITTDVLARGIDFERCNLVVHMDVPQRAETYLHRVGRTGRADTKGVSILMYGEAEGSDFCTLQEDLGYEIERVGEEHVLGGCRERVGCFLSQAGKAIERDSSQGAREAAQLDKGPDEEKSEPRLRDATNQKSPTGRNESTISKGMHQGSQPLSVTISGITESSLTTREAGKTARNDVKIESEMVAASEEASHLAKRSRTEQDSVLTPVKKSRLSEELTIPKKRHSTRAIEVAALHEKAAEHDAVKVMDSSNVPDNHEEAPKRRRRSRLDPNGPGLEMNGQEGTGVAQCVSGENPEADTDLLRMEVIAQRMPEAGALWKTLDSPVRKTVENFGSRHVEGLASESEKLINGATLDVTLDDGEREPTGGPFSYSETGERKPSAAIRRPPQTGVRTGERAGMNGREDERTARNGYVPAPSAEPIDVPAEAISQQCREAWGRFASEAYEQGYKEAYEEAFRLASRLRERLGYKAV